MAVTLSDLLMRRTRVFYEVQGNAVAEATELLDLIGEEAGWDAPRKASELSAYVEEVERGNLFRTELRDAQDLSAR
jgi:glycerol-3-phosphate dehydrogenase